MRPALEPGDWLLARRIRGTPARGAIVVVTVQPGVFLVKRVIGLPGERIVVEDGQVHVDGTTLAEPWVGGRTAPDSVVDVPADAVWVLGDNRALSSSDSRTIGPIPLSDVGWQAVGIYWPGARAGLLSAR